MRMNSLIVSIGKLPEWRSLLAGWCRPDQTGIPNSHHLATWVMRMMAVVGIVAVLVMMMEAKGCRDTCLQVIMCGRQIYHGIDRRNQVIEIRRELAKNNN